MRSLSSGCILSYSNEKKASWYFGIPPCTEALIIPCNFIDRDLMASIEESFFVLSISFCNSLQANLTASLAVHTGLSVSCSVRMTSYHCRIPGKL
mmetsp:Transcript_43819/g.70145  ORF Transcript_43819/g.70145 Transcript_43819/m.70145 type:complete len:95 (+) Transcript_43819:85-369(+)